MNAINHNYIFLSFDSTHKNSTKQPQTFHKNIHRQLKIYPRKEQAIRRCVRWVCLCECAPETQWWGLEVQTWLIPTASCVGVNSEREPRQHVSSSESRGQDARTENATVMYPPGPQAKITEDWTHDQDRALKQKSVLEGTVWMRVLECIRGQTWIFDYFNC